MTILEKFNLLHDPRRMAAVLKSCLPKKLIPAGSLTIRIEPLKEYRDQKSFNVVIRYVLQGSGGTSKSAVGLTSSGGRKRYAYRAHSYLTRLLNKSTSAQIPELYSYERSLGLILIEYIHGESLSKILAENQNTAAEYLKAVGQWLRALKRIKPTGQSGIRRGIDFGDLRTNLSILSSRSDSLSRQSSKFLNPVLRRLQPKIAALSRGGEAIVHGDFNPTNIIFRNGQCVVLDFEKTHIGHPQEDVAALTSHLEFLPELGLSRKKRKELISRFLAYVGPTSAAKENLSLFKVYFELLSLTHIMVWGKAEEKRRALDEARRLPRLY